MSARCKEFVINAIRYAEDASAGHPVRHIIVSIGASNREKRVGDTRQHRKETAFGLLAHRRAPGAEERRLIADEYRQAPPLCAQHRHPIDPTCVAMDPKRVEPCRGEPTRETPVYWALRGDGRMPPDPREKFMPVAVDERDIPLHRLSKASIVVGAKRHVRLKKDGKVNVWLGRYQPEQRRLILDRVRHQVR